MARLRCSSDEAARGRDGMTVHPSAPEDVAPAIAAGGTEHDAQDPTVPEASPAAPAAGSPPAANTCTRSEPASPTIRTLTSCGAAVGLVSPPSIDGSMRTAY